MVLTAKRKATRFQRDLKAALAPLKNSKRAAAMGAYMRDQFKFLGIGTQERREVATPLIRAYGPASVDELRFAAESLWKMREREYLYCAAELIARYQAVLTLGDLPWLLALAQQKSWWDSVDSLVKTVGKIVRRSGAKGRLAIDRAIAHKNFWVRRIAMLHQLGWRDACDTERLFRFAELLAAEKEFFIRKAIGWALRDYAWHDWQAVERFLKSTQAPFSGLTVREARKNFATLRGGGKRGRAG